MNLLAIRRHSSAESQRCAHTLHLLISSDDQNKDGWFFSFPCSFCPLLLCVCKPKWQWAFSSTLHSNLVKSGEAGEKLDSCECDVAGNIIGQNEREMEDESLWRHNWKIMRGIWLKLEGQQKHTVDLCPYVVGGSLLSIQGLGDKHVSADWVYVVDATGRLIGARSSDAVADPYVLILIWADLRKNRETSSTGRKIFPSFEGCDRLKKFVTQIVKNRLRSQI